MKRFSIFLFLSVLLSCAQTHNGHKTHYPKITVPEAVAQYY